MSIVPALTSLMISQSLSSSGSGCSSSSQLIAVVVVIVVVVCCSGLDVHGSCTDIISQTHLVLAVVLIVVEQ